MCRRDVSIIIRLKVEKIQRKIDNLLIKEQMVMTEVNIWTEKTKAGGKVEMTCITSNIDSEVEVIQVIRGVNLKLKLEGQRRLITTRETRNIICYHCIRKGQVTKDL